MNENFYMGGKPPHPNNCPPGHFISIANGGKGHWDGDGCCDSSIPASSIDMGISLLLLIGMALIFFIKYK